ncbi:MAG: methyltransferase domain-containing protein [Micrococcales bacterium]|nr:methyltransferase domain-containing protein [Micrococcales bacterium]
MQCDYFDAGTCRSCTLMGQPYAVQLASAQGRVEATLADHVPAARWLEPFAGPESGFRNKAKLVVGGRRGAPTLGILDEAGHGVDLTGCGLYEPGLAAALVPLREAVAEIGLTPYDVPGRTGELKHILLTHSPDGELMARFVLRSEGQLGRLGRAVQPLRERLPGLRVVTANLLPEHRAALEGETEIVLTEETTLPMRLGEVTLHLRPQSFFQTNTVVAQALYAQAREWLTPLSPAVLWDLYCGVGGFALHCAPSAGQVLGVEVAPEAVESARTSAQETGLAHVQFVAGDAFEVIAGRPAPAAVIVNPPRRGIGPRLAGWLEGSDASTVVYSSCNPESLARDLADMPSLEVRAARLFDMFPQSGHSEVMVLLGRAG